MTLNPAEANAKTSESSSNQSKTNLTEAEKIAEKYDIELLQVDQGF